MAKAKRYKRTLAPNKGVRFSNKYQMFNKILYSSFLLLLMSCGKSIKLTESDRSWMPYEGNETLVFKSNGGEEDTIFLKRKDTLWGLPDPALSVNKYEIVAIFCMRPIIFLKDEKKTKSVFEYYFMEIKKTMSGRAEINFNLSAKDCKFYRLTPVKVDSLNQVIPEILKTASGTYDDVYEILSDTYGKDFFNRSNFVTKLYWSKSSGLIRYEKKNGVYWELQEKF